MEGDRGKRGRTGAMALAFVAGLLAMTLGAGTAAAADSISVTTPFPAISVAPGSKASFDLSVTSSSSARVDLAISGVPDGLDRPAQRRRLRGDRRPRRWDDAGDGSSRCQGPGGCPARQTNLVGDRDERVAPRRASNRHHRQRRRGRRRDDDDGLPLAPGPRLHLVHVQPDARQRHRAGPDVRAERPGSDGLDRDRQADVADPGFHVPGERRRHRWNHGHRGSAGERRDRQRTPIDVTATAGDKTVGGQLQVEITGQFSMALTTPDGRLNANGAGRQRGRTDALRREHGHRAAHRR